MAKISRPLIYIGIAAVGVGAWILTAPDDRAKAPTKPRATSRVKQKETLYDTSDYEAKFTPIVSVTRDAFQPLIARKSALIGSIGAGGVPADFAGGDANWVCTGTAEVDGIRMALLENRASGEGVFLKQGDRWKRTIVSTVRPDSVVLVGPGGEAKTITVQSDNPEEVMPLDVDSALSGAIGQGLTVSPDGRAPAAPNPEQQAMPLSAPAMEGIIIDES